MSTLYICTIFNIMNETVCITLFFFFILFLRLILFVCFIALRPMSTAMVMVGQSVHLTTLFPGQA